MRELFRLGSTQNVSLNYRTASFEFNVRFIYGILHLKPVRLHGVSADSGPVLSRTSCITIKLFPNSVTFTTKSDQFPTKDMIFVTEELLLVYCEVRSEAFLLFTGPSQERHNAALQIHRSA
jgi:hypothetical protein